MFDLPEYAVRTVQNKFRHDALALSPNYDKLFDLGFITFKPTNGKIVLSDKIKPSDWDRLCIDDSKELRMVPRTTDKYLIV